MWKRGEKNGTLHLADRDKGRPAGDISDEIYELTFANIFSHVNNEIVVTQQ